MTRVRMLSEMVISPRFLLGLCCLLMACGQVGNDASAVGAGALGGFERAERGCIAQAERQGLFVEGVQFTQSTVQSGGRITGAETVLIARDGARTYPLRCHFTYRTGAARLSRT